jgi:hypothetical protein
MATYDSGLILAKTEARGLSGHVPKVKEYRTFSDKALDVEIIDSVSEAHAHYNGLRRELVLRLLPALSEMRRRYSAQGTRNDLQAKLGLPKKAGWEDYLHARGLKPDTVRNWFAKFAAPKALGLLIGHHSTGNVVVKPDVNVTAVELVRDIESTSRTEKLKEIVKSRQRLNPTVRKNLIRALKYSAQDATKFEKQLSRDFKDFPSNGKCHQRLIREHMARQTEAAVAEKRRLAADFTNAVVREISYAEARNVILGNEWLGNMGTTEFAFGLFFGGHLAGTVCYGSTAGSSVFKSICGEEHAHEAITLVRGACLHWAHPHSASFLISEACRQMTEKGFHLFVGYSDPEAGEIGTIYQASNWLYCGMTSPKQRYRTTDGKIHDSRQVHGLTRDRRGGTTKYKRTRSEQMKLLLGQGCEFLDGTPKHRYVGLYGDRRMKRLLRSALRWQSLPYPKRQQPATLGAPTGVPVGAGASAAHRVSREGSLQL